MILQDSIEVAGYIGDMPVELKNMSTHDGKKINNFVYNCFNFFSFFINLKFCLIQTSNKVRKKGKRLRLQIKWKMDIILDKIFHQMG